MIVIMQESKYIIGADEVGYGCWAGPLCVAAVGALATWHLPGLNDSKKLSRKKREQLSSQLWELSDSGIIRISLRMASNKEIDTEGVSQVQKRLFLESINACVDKELNDSSAIVDGTLILNQAILCVPYQSLIQADSKISTVMAASIVAKVHRDTYMRGQDLLFPEFDFINNVGYGTVKHRAALAVHGPTHLHRMSYRPLKKI